MELFPHVCKTGGRGKPRARAEKHGIRLHQRLPQPRDFSRVFFYSYRLETNVKNREEYS